MRIFTLIFLFSLFLSPQICEAQSDDLERFRSPQNRDVQLWTSISVKQRIGRKWNWKLRQDFRMDNYISQKKNIFTQAEIKYEINDRMKIGGLYRYSNRREDQTDRHRFGFKYYYRYEWNRFQANYRFYYQHEIEPNELAENMLRNRISINYDFKKSKFDPFVAVEHFFRIHHQGNDTRAMRYTAGFDIELSKKLDLVLYYRHQRQANRRDPLFADIFGFKLNFTLERIRI
jgi:hypothetical protein